MKTKQLLALLLTVIMFVGIVPMATFAQSVGEIGTVTDRYINEANGKEIATPQVVPATETKNPQKIVGYEYDNYSETTEHIYAKEDLNYIVGYPDKTVRGERYLSRAEASTIFYRLYDGFYPTLQRQTTSTTFSDIPQDAWYYKEVELCYNVNLIEGYADGTFHPDEPITRAEFAIIAARANELPNSDKQMFKDVTKDHWAYLLINSVAESGWIQGYPDGTYRPETTISRSETVTLINRMRNRSITVDELKKLGVVNPYIDLVETYWAYTDLIEATVKHSTTDWHHLTYNNSNLNIIVEKYVDKDGKEIAEPTITKGKENFAYRKFDKHFYLGYITTITYLYNNGKAQMVGNKSVDKATAKVGDTLTYTITAGNAETATDNLKNVAMSDVVPNYLNFTHGSVQVNGETAKYSFDNSTKQLSVSLGDIAPNATKTITFTATVNDTAYGKKFTNTAILSADNNDDTPITDDGVTIDDGKARLITAKSVDKAKAKVGDNLTYTITASNVEGATSDLKNVVMKDVIPTYLNFSYGSVQINGKTAQYAYDTATRLLTIELGDIGAGKTKTITFVATINETAYNKSFKNTAVLLADNDVDKPATDDGVTVEDGKAKMSATKSVDKATAKVGDTLTYTITATNADTATVNLKNVVMTDSLSEYMSFNFGSVQVDGYSARYSYNNNKLSVELGEIAPAQTKTITFTAVVNSTAYGKKFTNTAVLSADNDDDKTAKDGGVIVADGNAEGSIGAKTVSKSTAKVGDTLTYTITLRNASTATADWKNVKVADVIPEFLSFVSGSVEEDGRTSVNSSYSNLTNI